MNRHRIFISHATDDTQDAGYADLVKQHLEEGFEITPPVEPGWEYLEWIRQAITHSHLVVPIISRESDASIWVQHEIGYAVGLGIPIIPVVVYTDRDSTRAPRGLIERLQAECVLPGDLLVEFQRLRRGTPAPAVHVHRDFASRQFIPKGFTDLRVQRGPFIGQSQRHVEVPVIDGAQLDGNHRTLKLSGGPNPG